MDSTKVPYKLEVAVKTFKGDWTSEQIESGEADEAFRGNDVTFEWFEPSENGAVRVTDAARIEELERSIQTP